MDSRLRGGDDGQKGEEAEIKKAGDEEGHEGRVSEARSRVSRGAVSQQGGKPTVPIYAMRRIKVFITP
jgi:Mg-chelatase subunit ChlD